MEIDMSSRGHVNRPYSGKSFRGFFQLPLAVRNMQPKRLIKRSWGREQWVAGAWDGIDGHEIRTAKEIEQSIIDWGLEAAWLYLEGYNAGAEYRKSKEA
jgi:hypothetical protein